MSRVRGHFDVGVGDAALAEVRNHRHRRRQFDGVVYDAKAILARVGEMVEAERR